MQYALDSTYFFMLTRNIITKVLNWIGGVFEQNHNWLLFAFTKYWHQWFAAYKNKTDTYDYKWRNVFNTFQISIFFLKCSLTLFFNPKKQISGAFKGACLLMLVQFTNSFLKWCNKLYRCNTECQFSSRFKYTTL